ncbi:MAG: hypothetical protein WDA11_06400 [Thiohalomonadaceae bacterium]
MKSRIARIELHAAAWFCLAKWKEELRGCSTLAADGRWGTTMAQDYPRAPLASGQPQKWIFCYAPDRHPPVLEYWGVVTGDVAPLAGAWIETLMGQ